MKKRIFTLNVLVCCFVFLFCSTQVYAVPAYPHPIEYQLPDGSTITILLNGDERVNWAKTIDGYTLMRNQEGFYEYAVLNENGDLTVSGIRAKNESERTAIDVSFLSGIQKDLRYSHEQIDLLLQIRNMNNSFTDKLAERELRGGSRDFVGEVHAPIILVGFQGKPFNKTKEDFESLMNQPNYTAGGVTGSVYDYFLASSYGQLQFSVDVFGPYTLSHDIGYYDNNAGGSSQYMAMEGVMAADEDGCDFSLYDVDNDNYVDGIHFIFAGYGQEAGAPAGQAIWSHAWSLWTTTLILDGKQIYRYSCSPEFRGSNGNNMTYIGVIAHELSHVFGLPDLYDTDYEGSGGEAIDLETWDIMASGSWNDNGRTPAYHSAWCRDLMGWVNSITLSSPETITIPNPEIEGASYRINTATPNEYFLIENRQKTAWDAYIPGSGMLIYHVDENNSGWDDNCINCRPSRRGLYIKQAGGGANSTGGNAPYPIANNANFMDVSIPNSKSWAGANTEKPVTEITHNTEERTITFNFMDDDVYLVQTIANFSNRGTVEGYGVYPEGTSVTVNAIARQNYAFKEWRKNDVVVSNDAEYTFTVSEHTELTAYFVSTIAAIRSIQLSAGRLTPGFSPAKYEYTVNLDETTTHISITGTPYFENGSVEGNVENAELHIGNNYFTLTAIAEDGETTADYSITVIQTLIAIDEIENHQINIYPNPTKEYLVVESKEPVKDVKIYDSNGKLIDNITNTDNARLLLNTNSYAIGLYYISVDNRFFKFVKE
jgi:M6 family metalloprotease-like protein